MRDLTWIPVADHLPPDGVEVDTKISENNVDRNVGTLKRSGRLWFSGNVYVYYTPTHWRYKR